MLDGGIIQRLLEEKWKTFARVRARTFINSSKIAFLFIAESIFEAIAHPVRAPLLLVHFGLSPAEHAEFFPLNRAGCESRTLNGERNSRQRFE